MTLYNGHSIGKTLTLRLPNVFLMVQIIFHLFNLNGFQRENVTCNNSTLVSFCDVQCSFFSKPQSSQLNFIKQSIIEHHPSYMKYIIYYQYYYFYVFKFFQFHDVVRSSGEECFFGVIFVKMQIFFDIGTLIKVFEFLFAKKEGSLNWVHQI